MRPCPSEVMRVLPSGSDSSVNPENKVFREDKELERKMVALRDVRMRFKILMKDPVLIDLATI